MTDNQYGKRLADAYESTKVNPSPLQVLCYENFTRAVGTTEGRLVCDLGCGAGHSTRMLRMLGTPIWLVGLDISADMIAKAIAAETMDPTGIEYRCVDCTDIPTDFNGQFDLVTAMWLLHYASDRRALAGFARSIEKLLRPDGRLVTVVQDKFHIDERTAQFGEVRSWADEPGPGGPRQRISVVDGQGAETCHFYIHCWSRQTYTEALRAAGFKHIEWHDLAFSQESRNRYADWQLIESLASCSLLTAEL